ncbi:hypothetical protein ACWD6R_24565 [Streptomyces sp. NPDC005151]
MTSIERTAYPRFKRLITAHELHLFFAPSRDEVEWAATRTDCDEHLLAQLLALIREQQQAIVEALIGNYRTVLQHIDADVPVQAAREKAEALTPRS